MIEWAPSALRVAGEVLRHFLDGPERKLRKKKLELEIEQLSRREIERLSCLKAEAASHQGDPIDNDEFIAFRKQVLDELRILTESIPEIQFQQSSLRGPTLTRDGDPQTIISRLELAVEARRQDSTMQEPALEPPQAFDAPGSPESSLIEWTEPLDTLSEKQEQLSGRDAKSRIKTLQERIHERRRQDGA